MSAVFTEHAVDRMREIAEQPAEKAELADLLVALNEAATPATLLRVLPGTVQLMRGSRGDVLVATRGHMRAVIATDPSRPEEMIVTNVYRASEEEPEGDALRAAAARGEDIALVR